MAISCWATMDLPDSGAREGYDTAEIPMTKHYPFDKTEIGNLLGAGIWESTPGGFPIKERENTETIYIISGTAMITNKDGTTYELGPGCWHTLPTGWSGRWDITSTLRKLYLLLATKNNQVIHRAAASSSASNIIPFTKWSTMPLNATGTIEIQIVETKNKALRLQGNLVGVGVHESNPPGGSTTGFDVSERRNTETFYVLSGTCTITDGVDGTQHQLVPGSWYTLPTGWFGRWDMFDGRMRKLYVLTK